MNNLKELREMGQNLVEVSSYFAVASCQNIAEWSSVYNVGDELLNLIGGNFLDEKQQKVLAWIKEHFHSNVTILDLLLNDSDKNLNDFEIRQILEEMPPNKQAEVLFVYSIWVSENS